MRTLALSGARGRGAVVLIDDEDVGRVSVHRWFLASNGYVVANVVVDGERRTSVLLHRFLTGTPAGFDTDHRNRNRLDNRRANLRVATRSQNNANAERHRHSRQPFKGVRRRDGRWEARLASSSLGRFDTPEEAAAAYDRAAQDRYGEFARPAGGIA